VYPRVFCCGKPMDVENRRCSVCGKPEREIMLDPRQSVEFRTTWS
jgi:hypothetical protein